MGRTAIKIMFLIIKKPPLVKYWQRGKDKDMTKSDTPLLIAYLFVSKSISADGLKDMFLKLTESGHRSEIIWG